MACVDGFLEGSVPAVDGGDEAATYQQLLQNIPMLLTGCTSDWAAWKLWRNDDGSFNADAVAERFGDARVPVALCAMPAYGSEVRATCRLRQYLAPWLSAPPEPSSGVGCPAGGVGTGGCDAAHDDGTDGGTPPAADLRLRHVTKEVPVCDVLASPNAYMKDWHMVRDFSDHGMYTPPRCFRSDWLNAWWDAAGKDDYRFVYIGRRHTFTPLHHDILRSNSWSANVVGRKVWLLFPPSETSKLLDRRGEAIPDARWAAGDTPAGLAAIAAASSLPCPQLVAACTSTLDPAVAAGRWPLAASARRVVVVQEAGQVMYVPSGWYHQVHNVDDVVVSINHNWFNETTCMRVWGFLRTEVRLVRAALADCRNQARGFDAEWEAQVQVVMKANSSMHLCDWLALLRQQVDRAVAAVASSDSPSPHDVLALRQALRCVRCLAEDDYVREVVVPDATLWDADGLETATSALSAVESVVPTEWITWLQAP